MEKEREKNEGKRKKHRRKGMTRIKLIMIVMTQTEIYFVGHTVVMKFFEAIEYAQKFFFHFAVMGFHTC